MCYLIFLALVAVYHYSESHRVYAGEHTANKPKAPVVPTPPIVAVTPNQQGKPAPVIAPAPKPVPAKPAAQPAPNVPAEKPEPRVSVPSAPSNLTPGTKAKQGGQVNYKILGPGSVGVGEYYDTTLGSITKVTASSYLGNDHNAGAIEINGGPRIARLNLTYGLSFTDHQRVKLSAEYLEERLNYDFASGTSGHWDGQTAIGGGYDYLVENHYLQSVGVAGYFSHADSRDLSDATFTRDGQQFTENRRIAGANAGNVHFDVAGHLWPYSRVSGGADYDTVHFNTRYQNNDQNVHGFGGHAKVEQRLWPSVKVVAEGHWQQVDNEYLVGVNWLMPSPRGMQFELEGTTDYYDSLATNRRFYTNGVRLNANFGVPENQEKAIYSDLSLDGNNESLLDWTRTPAVRMTEVLAVADSRVNVNNTFKTTIACPDPEAINVREEEGGYYYSTTNGWFGRLDTEVNNTDITFDRGIYNVNGAAAPLQSICSYDVLNGRFNLELRNMIAGENTQNNWQTLNELSICQPSSGQANECSFTRRQDFSR